MIFQQAKNYLENDEQISAILSLSVVACYLQLLTPQRRKDTKQKQGEEKSLESTFVVKTDAIFVPNCLWNFYL